MRLGGPLFGDVSTPKRWIAELQRKGYRAAYCPIGSDAADGTVQAYRMAAQDADIVIAEVGAWSNPISPDPAIRSAAIRHCQQQLALADRIGARCCVNIAGSRGAQWDGPHRDNLIEETFERIVETVRTIIDAVQPTKTCYALETMPWIFPDSPESYRKLILAIDRPGFAVHLDPANLINCPVRYYENAHLIRECFRLLGPHIKSCHAKDILLRGHMTVHLEEVRPGLGGIDYPVFLTEAERLDPEMPLMLEHLPNEEEYDLAAAHVRHIAAQMV